MPVWLPAAIGAAGSLIATGVNNIGARRRLKDQREYDKPKNRVQRLIEAGFSPSYFYGGGSSMGSSPQQDASPIDPNIGQNAISQYQQTKLNKLQADLLKQKVRQEKAQADLDEDRAQHLLSEKQIVRTDPITKEEEREFFGYSRQVEDLKLARATKRLNRTILETQKSILLATKKAQIDAELEKFANQVNVTQNLKLSNEQKEASLELWRRQKKVLDDLSDGKITQNSLELLAIMLIQASGGALNRMLTK